jgi:serine/threonine protein phosphatase 1
MNFFVIADVHGCFYTHRELLPHWRPAEEILVQVGDLVDRGNYSPETVELYRYLSQEHPEQTIFLQGNHAWGLAQHRGHSHSFYPWLKWSGAVAGHGLTGLRPSPQGEALQIIKVPTVPENIYSF